MMRSALRVVMVVVTVVLAPLMGCSHQPPPSPQMSRVDAIVQKSGGDWNKVSQEDRDYLIRDVGKGSPISGEMTFRAHAGTLHPGASVHH